MRYSKHRITIRVRVRVEVMLDEGIASRLSIRGSPSGPKLIRPVTGVASALDADPRESFRVRFSDPTESFRARPFG